MNPFVMKMITSALTQMPAIVQEVESMIKDAESPEKAQAKVKALLADVVKAIETVGEML